MAVGRVKHGSRPPWVGLAAAAWVQVAAGSGFTFPLYSPVLKSVLGYSQQQLTLLGVANDVGENVGLIPGIACNRLPPWAVLLVGAVCSFLGFGVLWLAVTRSIVGVPYWVLWIALCIATNSGAWLGTAVLVTNMRNFPISRGAVAGILKGYVALSASVFTVIYSGVLHNSTSNLLLFLTFGIPTICVLMMYFIRPCVPSLEDDTMERGHFLFVQIAGVVLGLYLLLCTIVDDFLPVSDTVSLTLACVVIIILSAPLAVPVKMTLFPVKRNVSGDNGQSSSSQDLGSDILEKSEPLLESSSASHLGSFMEGDEDASDVNMLLAEGEGAVKKKRRPRRGEDFTFLQACVKADFWLLFLAYFLGVGSGVTVLNNLAQIGIASGVNDSTVLLCLFGFCNFSGRLCGGVISEHFVRSRTLPRPIWMTLTQLIMALTYILFAYGPKNTLYLSTILLGTCYGVQLSVMVPTASELFGLKHFGVIYNFMLLGNPLGALLFSALLAGYIYDQEAAKQQAGLLMDSTSCLGPQCFRLTFLVLACVCVLGSLMSAVLARRVRPVYQMLYSSGSFRLPRSSLH